MRILRPDDLDRAEDFLRRNARLLDRHRFAYHFRSGPAAAVLAALRPYENPDGGYGHALEPDLRGESSQPVPVQHALDVLHETGHGGDPAVGRAADYLAGITRPDGGVPFVLPSVRETPHAPWWQTPDHPPGAVNPTATLAGMLHRAGADHPWLGTATDFCWERLERGDARPGPYDALAILTFLDHVPDRDRAEAAFGRVRDGLLECVALDPDAPGHTHGPLDFAPAPGGFGHRLFDRDTLDAHLDHAVDARLDDGAWTVDFLIWTPVTEPEWRGHHTVAMLLTLRAYGRMRA